MTPPADLDVPAAPPRARATESPRSARRGCLNQPPDHVRGETVKPDAGDICEMSAVELIRALRSRALSATEVLDAVVARAEDLDEVLNPFSVRLHERAREQARASDALLARGDGGPLCGVPVTVKDTQYIAGVETTSGSRARIGHVPRETCAPVERLEDVGAVVFAKTATPEFCYFGVTESELHGPTHNPWNLGRTPGGSSGGAGAAVAAGIGPLSLGGAGGGSIRL